MFMKIKLKLPFFCKSQVGIKSHQHWVNTYTVPEIIYRRSRFLRQFLYSIITRYKIVTDIEISR